MYCRKCGKKINDHAQFCDHCGAEVVIVPQQSYADKYKENKKKAKSQAKQTSEQQKSNRKNIKMQKIHILRHLCLLLLFHLLVLFFHGI